MEHALELIAATLTRAKHPARYDRIKRVLMVDDIPVHCEAASARNGAPGMRVRGVGRYTDYKHGGYKLAEIVIAIVRALPDLKEMAERSMNEVARQKFARDLAKAHAADPRIDSICWTWDGKLQFRFQTDDTTLFGIVLDRVRETEYFDPTDENARPAPPPAADGARRYQLVDDDNNPISEHSFRDAYLAIPPNDDFDLDTLDSMIVGELRVIGTTRVMRIQ